MDEHAAGVGVELPNGEVLVAGGSVNGVVFSSGELLSADGTSFNPAGSMNEGRVYAAATLLAGGDVLVAGGDSATSGSASRTAEVWSRAGGGTFTATGSMNVPRQVFTLTTLPNGQALAVGGSPAYDSSSGSRTAELYDPVTQKWTLTGSMPSGRLGHSATLLPNCMVLIVGDAHSAVTFNYATGKFTRTGAEGAGSFQRSYQTATVLPHGKVLIAGGETAGRRTLNTASVYNPATGKFTPTSNTMSAPHSQGFAALLTNGKVLVGGGFGGPGDTGISAVDLYNQATNSWSSTASLPPDDYAYSVESARLQNGNVAVIGTGGAGNGSEIYTPTPSRSSVSAPKEDCSDLFSIVSVQSAAQGKLTVKVAIPFAGAVKATATMPAQKGVSKAVSYGSATQSAGHSGVLALRITPGAQAKALLRSRGSLKVSVAVTYTQPHKTPLHRSSVVTAHWS